MLPGRENFLKSEMRENREDVTEDRRDADLPPRFVGVGIPVFNSRFPRKKAAVFPHYTVAQFLR